MKINELLSEAYKSHSEIMKEIDADRPVIIWDKKTGKMGLHALNTDSDRVLHKDGRYKIISDKGWKYIESMKKFSDESKVDEEAILGHKPKRNPKYLSGTDKVADISPVLGSKPKKQKALMNKFFGSD